MLQFQIQITEMIHCVLSSLSFVGLNGLCFSRALEVNSRFLFVYKPNLKLGEISIESEPRLAALSNILEDSMCPSVALVAMVAAENSRYIPEAAPTAGFGFAADCACV